MNDFAPVQVVVDDNFKASSERDHLSDGEQAFETTSSQSSCVKSGSVYSRHELDQQVFNTGSSNTVPCASEILKTIPSELKNHSVFMLPKIQQQVQFLKDQRAQNSKSVLVNSMQPEMDFNYLQQMLSPAIKSSKMYGATQYHPYENPANDTYCVENFVKSLNRAR